MEEEKKEETTNYTEKIKNKVNKELEKLAGVELDKESLEKLYKLVDIDKDLENIDYWNVKKEVMKMRYNGYGDYSEGGYSEGGHSGNYGRRGVPGTGRGRYRGYSDGEEMLENMKESYGAYSESMGAYSRGNYSAGQDGMKALEDIMELFAEFTQKMIKEAESPEEKQIIKKYLRKVSQMG